MNFNMNQSIDKTECFQDSLITRKSLKLVDNISNQCYLIFYINYVRHVYKIQQTITSFIMNTEKKKL